MCNGGCHPATTEGSWIAKRPHWPCAVPSSQSPWQVSFCVIQSTSRAGEAWWDPGHGQDVLKAFIQRAQYHQVNFGEGKENYILHKYLYWILTLAWEKISFYHCFCCLGICQLPCQGRKICCATGSQLLSLSLERWVWVSWYRLWLDCTWPLNSTEYISKCCCRWTLAGILKSYLNEVKQLFSCLG